MRSWLVELLNSKTSVERCFFFFPRIFWHDYYHAEVQRVISLSSWGKYLSSQVFLGETSREHYNYCFSGRLCVKQTVPEHRIFSVEASPEALALWM